jgi:hypothetical protein
VHVDGTDPYPWPYDGVLEGATLALVLVGWDDGWSDRCPGGLTVRARGEELAAAVVAHGGLVVTVSHRGSAALGLAEVHHGVAAHGIDGFHGGPLDDVLRGAGCTHLLVGGFGLEGPVHSTLRSANDRGYECLLLSDASAPLTDDLAPSALSSVTMSGGIFGAVGTTPAVLAALTPIPAEETA